MSVIRHVVFRGRVQGVGFRAFVAERALVRNIAGWVRNRADGTVESVFSGPSETIESMIAECGKGPLGARIDAVYRREATAEEFSLRRPGEIFSTLPTV